MGTIVFIAALAVFVVIVAWYFQNEAKSADGSVGSLALRGDAAIDDDADGAGGASYRVRERLTPARRKGAAPAAQARAYRTKPAEKPNYRDEDDPEADKEY